jgi:predicted nucleic acid-binding protein
MSGFLLDTNVPSEVARARPNPRVAAWVNGQKNSTLFLSAVSIGELRRGFALLPLGERRTRLERWFETDVLLWFGERILPVTKEIADRWGTLDATCQLRGTPANTADGMIAATALDHGLTVVTRNVKDFSRFGVTVLNPWDDEPEPAEGGSGTPDKPAQ